MVFIDKINPDRHSMATHLIDDGVNVFNVSNVITRNFCEMEGKCKT